MRPVANVSRSVACTVGTSLAPGIPLLLVFDVGGAWGVGRDRECGNLTSTEGEEPNQK